MLVKYYNDNNAKQLKFRQKKPRTMRTLIALYALLMASHVSHAQDLDPAIDFYVDSFLDAQSDELHEGIEVDARAEDHLKAEAGALAQDDSVCIPKQREMVTSSSLSDDSGENTCTELSEGLHQPAPW